MSQVVRLGGFTNPPASLHGRNGGLVNHPTRLFAAAPPAAALTIEQAVTPASVNENPKRFTITAETRKDGLIHFKIILALPRPAYLVATSALREGGKVVSQNTACAFARESSATYYLTVSPDRLADSTFELFEGSFTENGGHPVAEPGGVEFKIDLAEFAKTAVEGK